MGPDVKEPLRAVPGITTSVQCADCGAVFSRAEHLTRHRRSHTNERPFVCSDCGKSFSRVDVLTRHAASHHEAPPSPARDPGVFPRACRECAASRVRCSRGNPCNRCSRKNLQCAYPTARKRRASEEGAGRAARPGEQIHMNQTSHDAGGVSRRPEDPNMTPTPGIVPGQLPWMLLQQEQPADGGYLDGMQPPPEPCFGDPVPVPDASMSAMNWLSPDDNMQLDWAAQLAATAGGFEALGFPFLADTDLPAEALTWPPAPSAPGPQVAEAAEAPPASNYAAEQSPRSTTPLKTSDGGGDGDGVARSATSATSASTVGMFYVDGDPWRAPLKASPTRRRSTRSILGMGDERTPSLPSNGTAAAGEEPRVDAPPAQVYDAMLSRIKTEAALWEGQRLDLGNYPHPSQMQTFFGLYFQCFHHTAPFLRRDASFLGRPCNWVLLLALCAVGSRYSPGHDSPLLFDILEKALSHRAGCFPFETALLPWATPRAEGPDDDDPLALLQAAVLNLVWKVHGGWESAARGALLERHRVVMACRNMELLDKEHERASASRDWWEEQSRTRTGLMIWLLDSILEYEVGSQPLLRLGDLKSSLPCRESLWEDPHSPTPQEPPQTTTIHDAIETLYTEKRLPPTLSDFAVTLLTHAVCRRSTEAVHAHQTPLATWIPTATTQPRAPSAPAPLTWPPSLPILSRWRNSACDCLDALHLHGNSVIAKGWGWEPPAVLHLHLSRMLILTPVAALQGLASASVRRGRGVDAKGARGRVLRWAIDDQFKARLAVIHAGSTFWHVRRHSAGSFLEPFTVFLATLILWAYSTSVQFTRQSLSSQKESAGDTPLSARTNSKEEEREEEEDAEPQFLHLDRPLDDEAVQAYVRLGLRMTGYLSRVGDICKEGAPRRILREGRDVLLRGRREAEEGFVWGVARKYVEALGCLVQSSGE